MGKIKSRRGSRAGGLRDTTQVEGSREVGVQKIRGVKCHHSGRLSKTHRKFCRVDMG